MSEAIRYASLRADTDAPVLPIESPDLTRLRAALNVLASANTNGQSDQWRRSVLRSVRRLVEADQAALILWLPGGPVVYAEGIGEDALEFYASRRAALDRDRARELGVEVWTLEQLWTAKVLKLSGHDRAFTVPNRLHDTVGITVQLQQDADVCLYLHRERISSPRLAKHRLALLDVILPAFRAAFEAHLRGGEKWQHLASVMDATGQALALYDMNGQELRLNPVMRRVLGQDPESERLRAWIREVAAAVLAALDRANGTRAATQADGTRREVATSMAAYRLRGNPVGRNPLKRSGPVLVSLDRVAFQIPAPDSLRTRYRLTSRELQVASLLMHRLSNAEIARMLCISPHTARHHTENVLLKFGVRSRAAVRRLISGEPTGPAQVTRRLP
jgi:DNA-binding CsgD family transcriptional regulator